MAKLNKFMKYILPEYKGYIKELCLDKYAHYIVLKILSIESPSDIKFVYKEIKNNYMEIAKDKYGNTVL